MKPRMWKGGARKHSRDVHVFTTQEALGDPLQMDTERLRALQPRLISQRLSKRNRDQWLEFRSRLRADPWPGMH
eukprot:1553091-Alexandrium_andersonii.AAC.1